ncbi:MAG: hypothetical protein CL675_01325 [Bdellovibrionaceae bacterium]|nr:hypothetical protein [Pseudobdellovibrionaceae bacterium]
MKNLIFGLILVISVSSLACDCGPRLSPEESYEEASAVFVATTTTDSRAIDNVVYDFEDGEPPFRMQVNSYGVQILAPIKGQLENVDVVTTGVSRSMCGIDFKKDGTYLIYAYATKYPAQDNKSFLQTSYCTRTQEL